AGVLGAKGKGSLEYWNVSRRRIIQTITLSKAFGVYGGAILGTPQLRKKIFEKSSIFVGSTPVPLPLATAAVAALEVLRSDPILRKRLANNTDYVRQTLHDSGLHFPDTPGPIIAIFPATPRDAARFSRQLLRAKILPPFILYPGGPASGYFRFVISS